MGGKITGNFVVKMGNHHFPCKNISLTANSDHFIAGANSNEKIKCQIFNLHNNLCILDAIKWFVQMYIYWKCVCIGLFVFGIFRGRIFRIQTQMQMQTSIL